MKYFLYIEINLYMNKIIENYLIVKKYIQESDDKEKIMDIVQTLFKHLDLLVVVKESFNIYD